MPISDAQEVIRQANDIDWLEEEAWRRAAQWTITPQLLFAMMDLVQQEMDDKNNG
jgi:hypothetical protein